MNNLQYIVKNDTRAAMHMAVELCERGDFDSVSEAFRWLSQETVGNYTRYHEMFGTPERAARTLHEAEGWTCPECPIRNQCKANWPYEPCPTNDYDSLLEWLRGDA